MTLLLWTVRARTSSSRQPKLSKCIQTDALHRLVQRPVQQYIATSNDPYLNLSIEHYLLQKSPPDSAISFTYVNRPSIVIGRNQNPWFEVNLSQISDPTNGIGHIHLVRRRSGGGTVFHDPGNINWCVISPPGQFTRDKHVEMVVRALRTCGVDRARVNERHDIVLDQGTKSRDVDVKDTHMTAYEDDGKVRSLKVSGSAYKLTKYRALHHGTCLLASPHVASISHLLRSPLKPYLTAKGVESVSSPVDNIGVDIRAFTSAVYAQFQTTYPAEHDLIELGEECLQIPEIRDGVAELKSMAWTFLQTPQFTLSVAPEAANARIELLVRYGTVKECRLFLGASSDFFLLADHILEGRAFHEIDDWSHLLHHNAWTGLVERSEQPQLNVLVDWLERTLPKLTRK